MWPNKIIRQFNTVPVNPSESDYHGPYNKLLYTLFPPDSDFVVVPQYLRPDSPSAADFIVMFEILLVNRPVFILELKPPSHLGLLSKRQAADDQLRSRMTDIVENCPLPTLHAVSALGTRLCFYRLDKNGDEIIPPAIARNPVRVNDTAPIHRWDCDILEADGEHRFRAIVAEIIQGCTGENDDEEDAGNEGGNGDAEGTA